MTNFKMKWHKFTINFLLFFIAICSAISSIAYFNGTIHSLILGSTVITDSANVYAQHPMMHTFDILFGIFYILLAVLFIVTRFKLAGFKTNAPRLLYVTLALAEIISIAYSLVSIIVLGFAMIYIYTIVAAVIVAIIELIIYAVYYSKRKSLFTN